MKLLIHTAFAIFVAILVPQVAFPSTLYKCPGENGRVIYSDHQCPNGSIHSQTPARTGAPPQTGANSANKAAQRFMTKVIAAESKRCDSGDKRSCEMVECLTLDEATAGKEKLDHCKALGNSARSARNREAAKKAAAGEQYVNPYWDTMIEASREVMAENCAAGDKRACKELERTPTSMADYKKRSDENVEKAKAACESGKAKGQAKDCQMLYCDENKFTDECKAIMQKNGRPVGANWYQTGVNTYNNGELDVILKCFDDNGSWRRTLRCFGTSTQKDTCASGAVVMRAATGPVALREAGDQACRR